VKHAPDTPVPSEGPKTAQALREIQEKLEEMNNSQDQLNETFE